VRSTLAIRVELLGKQLNQLRNDLLAANYVFSAGLMRAAEEAVLIVCNMLNDNTVDEREL
jgi:hypothetical protein